MNTLTQPAPPISQEAAQALLAALDGLLFQVALFSTGGQAVPPDHASVKSARAAITRATGGK